MLEKNLEDCRDKKCRQLAEVRDGDKWILVCKRFGYVDHPIEKMDAVACIKSND